jgi:tetratricopeptide (TPR) repeat protein
MRSKTFGLGLALLLTLSTLTLLAACGGDGAAEGGAGQDAQWAELEQMKEALDAKRAELDEAREQLATAEGEEAEQLRARVDQLAAETLTMTDDFNTRLVGFINENAPVVGEPLTERQQAALRMKSDEDIVFAREYIAEGGDYARAIDIYNAALAADPGNPEIEAALAEAQDQRYMDEERFGQLARGMSGQQVRQLLGTPYHRNVREYEDGAVGWFYPTDANRSAAAVYFRKKGDGLEVYKFDYKAVVNQGPREVGAANGQPG